MTKEGLFKAAPKEPDQEIYRKIKENWNRIAKPLDSLGYLEDIVCRLGAIRGTERPVIKNRTLVIMCADNGIVEEGVSQSGQDVTLMAARSIGKGGSCALRMAEASGTKVMAVDIGIASSEKIEGVQDRKIRKGTRNFLKEPAMTEEDLLRAVETGIDIAGELCEKGCDMLLTGEMGIGNTTTSTALIAALLDKDVKSIVTRGAGLSDEGLKRKACVIEKALEKYSLNMSAFKDQKNEMAFEALRCVGGLDIAGMCGLFIGGALKGVPVVIDGIISAAAAICAMMIAPGTERYMLASHLGTESVMPEVFSALSAEILITGRLALGEGSGALMLPPLIEMALSAYNCSGSFEDIGVEQYKRF